MLQLLIMPSLDWAPQLNVYNKAHTAFPGRLSIVQSVFILALNCEAKSAELTRHFRRFLLLFWAKQHLVKPSRSSSRLRWAGIVSCCRASEKRLALAVIDESACTADAAVRACRAASDVSGFGSRQSKRSQRHPLQQFRFPRKSSTFLHHGRDATGNIE